MPAIYLYTPRDTIPKEKSIKEIEDLPGIGPTIAEKLRAAGYDTLDKIGVASPHEISELVGMSVDSAKKAVDAAKTATTLEYSTGAEIYDIRKSIGRITTNCKDLDELLGGGVEAKAITEAYGRFASGKTQLGFQLAVNAQLPVDKGGMAGNVLFIDTEGSLPYEETVLLEIDGKLRFEKIGEVVEQEIKGAKETKTINGSISAASSPRDIKAISFDPQTLKVGKFEITGFIKHPIKKIYRVKLASGREVKTTEYHNFFTLNEEADIVPTYLKDLESSDFVAVPAFIPNAESKNDISKEEAEFLGLYAAEGSMIPDDRYKTGHYLTIITQKENAKVEEIVKNFVKKRGLKYHRNKMDYRIYSKSLTEELKNCYQFSPYNSHTKKIPDSIINSDSKSQNWFLNGYLLGDGSFDKLNNTQNADTVSRFLANDMLYMMASQRVPARNQQIFRLGLKSKGGPSQTYNIHWTVDRLKDRNLERLPNNNLQIGKLLKKIREENDLTQSGMGDSKHFTPVSQIETGVAKAVSRSKLKRLLSSAKAETPSVLKLKRLINSEIWFDKVVSIEEVSEEVCYDFEVLPGKRIENFIGGYGGIFLHNTFRPERIESIAKAAGLDPKETLANIFVVRAETTEQQILSIDKAEKLIKEHNIKLIIVDSLMALFRSEFAGRASLGERQQKLNAHIHKLQQLADAYKLAVYITNQVMDNPGILFGDPTTPVGGNIVAHAATTRLYFRKSKEDKRIVRLVDSPNMPEGEAVMKITTNGIRE